MEVEAKKQGVSLSEYIKQSLKNGLVSTQILNTENTLSNSKEQIKKLSEISDEAINEVERKIKMIGVDAENNKYTKQLRRMYWILISTSTLFALLSIPVLFFTIEYLNFIT